MIFSRKSSKFIAAVLTAALALSPVFMSPITADDGQDVETQASSWRYQDGDIIIVRKQDNVDSGSIAVVLVDGERLAKLMIEYDVGVSTQSTYAIKKIDSDFFSEEND